MPGFWGVSGARAAGEGWAMPDISPGQTADRLKKAISLRVRFQRTQQDSNLRTRLRRAIPRTTATSGNAA